MKKMDLSTEYIGYVDSPIGPLEIHCSEDSLVSVEFTEKIGEATIENEILKNVKNQLVEYFEGKRKVFDLKLFLDGTEFQKRFGWSLEIFLTEKPFPIKLRQKELEM